MFDGYAIVSLEKELFMDSFGAAVRRIVDVRSCFRFDVIVFVVGELGVD